MTPEKITVTLTPAEGWALYKLAQYCNDPAINDWWGPGTYRATHRALDALGAALREKPKTPKKPKKTEIP